MDSSLGDDEIVIDYPSRTAKIGQALYQVDSRRLGTYRVRQPDGVDVDTVRLTPAGMSANTPVGRAVVQAWLEHCAEHDLDPAPASSRVPRPELSDRLRAASLVLRATAAARGCRRALDLGERRAALFCLGDLRDSTRQLRELQPQAPLEVERLTSQENKLAEAIASRQVWGASDGNGH